MTDKCNLEEKVFSALKNTIFNNFLETQNNSYAFKKEIGAAVSGGADSVALLVSLCNILTPLNIKVRVITVNHFIRPAEETCGDVIFVQDLCEKLKNENKLVDCTVVELKPGQVQNQANERKAGIEEAARFLRYEAFENFIKKENLEFLCLAHNQNDNYETLLMRFLQGSSCEGLKGIGVQRDKFIRPLLDVSRAEIEDYLIEKNISWKTDSTNLDDTYFRNKIRLKLIPFLDENFGQWKKGLDATINKANEDYEIISEIENSVELKDNSVLVSDFEKLPLGLKKRVLLKLCNLAGENSRISSDFLDDVCRGLETSSDFTKIYKSIKVFVKNNRVFVKKSDKKQTDLCFFDIIEESGVYNFPFGRLEVISDFNSNKTFTLSFFGKENRSLTADFLIKEITLPVCVRNSRLGDEIFCKDGNYKKVSQIFSDWHVESEKKAFIPLIQELNTDKQELICIVGSVLGYKDWLVVK